MLYHPSIDEIRPIIARARRAWPHLFTRLENAEKILIDFDIRYRGAPQNTWQIHSQVKPDGSVARLVRCRCRGLYLHGLPERTRACPRARLLQAFDCLGCLQRVLDPAHDRPH